MWTWKVYIAHLLCSVGVGRSKRKMFERKKQHTGGKDFLNILFVILECVPKKFWIYRICEMILEIAVLYVFFSVFSVFKFESKIDYRNRSTPRSKIKKFERKIQNSKVFRGNWRILNLKLLLHVWIDLQLAHFEGVCSWDIEKHQEIERSETESLSVVFVRCLRNTARAHRSVNLILHPEQQAESWFYWNSVFCF